ncbi:Aste57867_9388 [Aphanomyces stellatus]|uniref:Aste57867_9388 protein n=1 Tax=Aphanomyces stellatus TaxID=120398 RepID=A0A485KMW6_9STRA|nr:hypothetical protein As57867_009352 [Aphanomyces stellatus]VFT86268.1 Aste57867_9388 [Aphanomyces stellatus]
MHSPMESPLRPSSHHDDKSLAEGLGTWTADEHDRFLQGVRLFPRGPWKNVAEIVQTRSVRQIRSHAQKYREKIARHQRGLRFKSPARDDTRPASPIELSDATTNDDDDGLDSFDVTTWWEPLARSCTPSQLEECLAFLSEAFSDPTDDAVVEL